MSHLDFTPPEEPEGPGCAVVVAPIVIFMLGVFGAGVCLVTGGNVFAWIGSAALMCGGIFLFVRVTR